MPANSSLQYLIIGVMYSYLAIQINPQFAGAFVWGAVHFIGFSFLILILFGEGGAGLGLRLRGEPKNVKCSPSYVGRETSLAGGGFF
jgi:hypothetical protein